MKYIIALFSLFIGFDAGCGAAAIERHRDDGCIVTPYKGWTVKYDSSEVVSKLGCDSATFERAEASCQDISLPDVVDLRTPTWQVKDQLGLGTCAIFSIVGIVEFLTNVRFSEAELTLRLASGRYIKEDEVFNSRNEGFRIDSFLPFIRAGLIPESYGIPYKPYNAYAQQRPENERLAESSDYRTSIEHAKKFCCDERNSKNILPRWVEKEELLFARGVCRIKVARPVGFWGHTTPLKFNVFLVNPENVLRLKYILNFVPVAIAMDSVYCCDPETHIIDKLTKSWWGQIGDARGGNAIIEKFPDHEQKLASGALGICGAHAVCLCGYDDSKKAFIFKNSWGESYANNGYGYIHYDVFRTKFNKCYISNKTGETPVMKEIKQGGRPFVHVYDARVIITHPTTELTPDILEEAEVNNPAILNNMLMEFKQRRTKGEL